MGWVDLSSLYVKKSGDTMTGSLIVPENATLTCYNGTTAYNVGATLKSLQDSMARKDVVVTHSGNNYNWVCFKSGDNWVWNCVIALTINSKSRADMWIPLPNEGTGVTTVWDGYLVQATMMSDQGTNIDYFNNISWITCGHQSTGFMFSVWNDSSNQLTYRFALTVTPF